MADMAELDRADEFQNVRDWKTGADPAPEGIKFIKDNPWKRAGLLALSAALGGVAVVIWHRTVIASMSSRLERMSEGRAEDDVV